MSFVPVQPNLFGNQGHQPQNQGSWSPQPEHNGGYAEQSGYQGQQQYDYGQAQQYGQDGGYNMGQGYDQSQQQQNYGEAAPYGAAPGYRAQSPPMAPNYMPGGVGNAYVAPHVQPMGGNMGSPAYQGGGAHSPPAYGAPSPMGAGFEQAMGQFGDQFGQLGALANPLARMGMAQAQQFVASVNDGFVARWTGSLRYYFSVNNMYVLHKLKILLFPFIHKSWSRKIVQAADGREMYLPPNQDVNAPDLYIPTMAFVTYILFFAVIMATSVAGFKPDVLGVTASSGIVTLALEVFIVKLGFYLLSYPPVLILDLVAYCGYKFVGILLILAASWTLGWLGFLVSFLILAMFMAIFMVKTLRLVVPQPMEAMPRNTRNYALITIAVLQAVFTFILCWMDTRAQKDSFVRAVAPPI